MPIILKPCAICENTDNTEKYISIYNPKTKENNFLIKCNSCGLVYAQDLIGVDRKFMKTSSNGIDTQEYEKIFLEDIDVYAKGSWGDSNQDTNAITEEQYIKTEEILKDLLNKDQVNLIEIGSARGYLLSFIKSKHPYCNVIGIEPSPVMAEYALSNGIQVVNGVFQDGRFNKETIDAVISYGAFICIRDPNSALKQISSCLKKGGRVIFDSPNSESLTRKVLHFIYPKLVFLRVNKPFDFRVWQAFNPRRFYFYSPSTFTKLLKKYDLDVDVIKMYQPRSLMHDLDSKPFYLRAILKFFNWVEVKQNSQNWILISAVKNK